MFQHLFSTLLFVSLRFKGIEFLPQTLILKFLYLYNPMSQTLDISNYDFCNIKQSKFEISKDYNNLVVDIQVLENWDLLQRFNFGVKVQHGGYSPPSPPTERVKALRYNQSVFISNFELINERGVGGLNVKDCLFFILDKY